MNNKKQASLSSIIIWAVAIAVILLYNGVLDVDPEELVPIVIVVIITGVCLAVVTAAAKAKAGGSGQKADAKKPAVQLHRPFPQPTAVKARPVLHHADEAEEAVTCAHRTGREKYLEQVEGFYKNGLIDRAEYKVLREKYEKMDIPEDYH